MPRQSLTLVVVCGLLLVGAWGASRALLADPPAPTPVAPPPPPPAPEKAAPHFVELEVKPRPALERLDPAGQAAAQQAIARVQNPTPAAPRPTTADGGPLEPDEVAPSPFVGDSPELDYADHLIINADGGVEAARAVYEKCLAQHPDNERCREGLARADRLEHPVPTKKGTLAPATFQKPANHLQGSVKPLIPMTQ